MVYMSNNIGHYMCNHFHGGQQLAEGPVVLACLGNFWPPPQRSCVFPLKISPLVPFLQIVSLV